MLELHAEIRTKLGKQVKSLRKKDFLPAVVYGRKVRPLPLKVIYQEFDKVYQQAGESTLVRLKLQDKKQGIPVLIYDVQKDPVTDKLIHVDFYQVRMDKKITTEIPLSFEGEAPIIEREEGVLVKNITEVEIEALPGNLPHEIKVDISSLDSLEDVIRIEDLKVPRGVKILQDPEEVVVSVVPLRAEEEIEALEEEVEEKVEEVEGVEKEEEVSEEAKEEKKGKKEEGKEKKTE